MYSTDLLLAGIKNQFNILKHLWTKVTAENQNYTITEWTRTAFELMKYLAFEAPAQINLIKQWWWNADLYKSWQDKWSDFTFDQFATKLDEAYEYIQWVISSLTPEQLDENMAMRWMNWSRTMFLTNYFLVFLGAYTNHLFLILKASGLKNLWTWNLRAGMDEPQKA